MDDLELKMISMTLSIFSTLGLIIALYLSYKNLRNHFHISANRSNLEMINVAERMIIETPDLLELHGLKIEKLNENGISIEEFAYIFYILTNFRAGQAHFYLKGTKKDDKVNYSNKDLRSMRKTLLMNEKVRHCWSYYIKERFISSSSYTRWIDKAIEEIIDEATTSDRQDFHERV